MVVASSSGENASKENIGRIVVEDVLAVVCPAASFHRILYYTYNVQRSITPKKYVPTITITRIFLKYFLQL